MTRAGSSGPRLYLPTRVFIGDERHKMFGTMQQLVLVRLQDSSLQQQQPTVPIDVMQCNRSNLHQSDTMDTPYWRCVHRMFGCCNRTLFAPTVCALVRWRAVLVLPGQIFVQVRVDGSARMYKLARLSSLKVPSLASKNKVAGDRHT